MNKRKCSKALANSGPLEERDSPGELYLVNVGNQPDGDSGISKPV